MASTIPSTEPALSVEDGNSSCIDSENSEDGFNGEPIVRCSLPVGLDNSLTFPVLLRHWSALTLQHQEHLTIFLKLMKHYRPEINYDDLPMTGKQLMFINSDDFRLESYHPSFEDIVDIQNVPLDTIANETSVPTHIEENNDVDGNPDSSDYDAEGGSLSFEDSFSTDELDYTVPNRDSDSSWGGSSADDEDSQSEDNQLSTSSSRIHPLRPPLLDDMNDRLAEDSPQLPTQKKGRRNRKTLLKASVLPNNGGKLMYFGLKRAILGDSPGIMFKHADLLQYLNIYMEEPNFLPKSLRQKVKDISCFFNTIH